MLELDIPTFNIQLPFNVDIPKQFGPNLPAPSPPAPMLSQPPRINVPAFAYRFGNFSSGTFLSVSATSALGGYKNIGDPVTDFLTVAEYHNLLAALRVIGQTPPLSLFP